jgi:hypothetical protein
MVSSDGTTGRGHTTAWKMSEFLGFVAAAVFLVGTVFVEELGSPFVRKPPKTLV